MLRFLSARFAWLLPLASFLLLALAGCGEGDHSIRAAEGDEPDYREGQSLLKAGRQQEALNAFLHVIDKRGDDAPESHMEVGLLYLEHINDPLSAIYHFKKYLALRPNSQLAPQVRQRIDAATREFGRTLPAQPLEAQLQRVDLVATLDRLKQENDSLKQELADLKSGRNIPVAVPKGLETESPPAAVEAPTPVPAPAGNDFSFSLDAPVPPTVRTRAPTVSPNRAPALKTAPSRAPASAPVVSSTPPNAPTKSTAARRHTVQRGDTLSKLAQQYYNNRNKWRDIYLANRDVMKGETDLKVGQQLKIP